MYGRNLGASKAQVRKTQRLLARVRDRVLREARLRQGGPASCGLQRANWTYAELAAYLYQQTGITVRETTTREFCHRHQVRLYRPTYRYLRGNPQRRAQARGGVAAMKKKRS